MGLPKPKHPLISVIHLDAVQYAPIIEPTSMVFNFYSVSLKRDCGVKIKYGSRTTISTKAFCFLCRPIRFSASKPGTIW